MTIFIIFRQQKTHSRVAENQALLHAAEIARPLWRQHALYHALHSVAHSYLRVTCLLRRSCTKRKGLNNV